ncbi:uncharacterized protein TNCV_2305011 [Trichonephila clavipes]|nr:uncharacterized protein TNCV_2305011 [Trichonephila clavipes]
MASMSSFWCGSQVREWPAPTRGLLATDHVILNHGQVTWTTPELAPPLLTTTPHQREDVSALDRFNVHRCPTRRVFSGTGLEPVTKQATVRYLYHSASAATLVGGVAIYRVKVQPVLGFVKFASLPLERKRQQHGGTEDPSCRVGRCTLNMSKLERISFGVLRSYSKAFSDGPRYFEPWPNWYPSSPNSHTTSARGRLYFDGFDVHQLFYTVGVQLQWVRTYETHQSRVHDLNH